CESGCQHQTSEDRDGCRPRAHCWLCPTCSAPFGAACCVDLAPVVRDFCNRDPGSVAAGKVECAPRLSVAAVGAPQALVVAGVTSAAPTLCRAPMLCRPPMLCA